MMDCQASEAAQQAVCSAADQSSHSTITAAQNSFCEQHSSAPQPENLHRKEGEIKVRVSLLNGGVFIVDTYPSATVHDLKATIHSQTGHTSCTQRLLLDDTLLADSDAVLKDIRVADASALTLLLTLEPIGQSSLKKSNGEKRDILPSRPDGTPLKEHFDKFQLMSWEAAFKADNTHVGVWDYDEDEDEKWPNLGAWGLDLYWTTGSDGCRYEYWSSAPGDNESGILICIDAHAMTAIGMGSDDGLELFKEFRGEGQDNDVVRQLIQKGWPKPECWASHNSEAEEEEEEEDSDEEE